LRSPTYPDPDADQGEHRFTYSLLPHPGDWRAGTVPEAYALNDPLILRRVSGGKGSLARLSLVAVETPNVVVETVKQAEDGRGIIVRLYESHRRRGSVTLRVGFPLARAYRCSLLEEDETALNVTENVARLTVKPYQVMTIRLVPAVESRIQEEGG